MASHAQLAYHQRPAAWMRCAVGTTEKGLSIRISGVFAFSTSAWASWRRRHAATTSSAVSPVPGRTSSADGARPSSTNSEYVRLRTVRSSSSTSAMMALERSRRRRSRHTASVDTPPPIACTLNDAALADRAGAWRAVIARGLRERADTDDGVALSLDASVEGDIRMLVALEAECCAWFEGDVTRAGDTVVVALHALDADGRDVLRAMFDELAAR